jgi:molybdopterin-guanine dinucleotide biosynthesis protein B
MRVVGFTGWSGSGKTTLLTAVLPHLAARGLRIATVKHAHHEFDLDQPGKDSWRHRAAGAREVLIASGRRWALLHENEGPEPDLDALLARLSPADLVLVEGFKSSPYPKLEVHRPSLGGAPIWPGRADIVAVASDETLAHCPRPVLPLGDPACIAGWIVAFLAGDHSLDRNA